MRYLWVVLDPELNVKAVVPMRPDGGDRVELLDLLGALPPVPFYAGVDMHAPVIILPDVLEQDLCRQLIQAYDRHGGEVSGFMREVNGKTVGVYDDAHKRRRDYQIDDPQLQQALQRCVQARVAPAIRKAHCFEATRMERYIVGC
ncbi:hypothetical protein [Pelomonas cellulosilytica]|uniref:Uncharacterized protein n=1 Tax=Pelomonas cellulosilytica TaxID=2906762 RepID=A0ABS8XZ26_9BURK|nr:hypothetical protein [Pelomonas sp. P8]MCE4556548.1 hypothetical protein [Pelomonas sp. P8]